MLNTSRILASLVRMVAEFILVSIDTTISMKQQELAEKKQIFLKGTQNGQFWAKKSQNWPFFGLTLKGSKILNTSRFSSTDGCAICSSFY